MKLPKKFMPTGDLENSPSISSERAAINAIIDFLEDQRGIILALIEDLEVQEELWRGVDQRLTEVEKRLEGQGELTLSGFSVRLNDFHKRLRTVEEHVQPYPGEKDQTEWRGDDPTHSGTRPDTTEKRYSSADLWKAFNTYIKRDPGYYETVKAYLDYLEHHQEEEIEP